MSANWCEKCQVFSEKRFCSDCGKEMVKFHISCPHCETELCVLDKFCGNCGRPVQESIKAWVNEQRKEVDKSDGGCDVSGQGDERSG